MKNFKAIIPALLIIIGLGHTKAAPVKLNDEGLSVNHAVNIYVDAISLGRVNNVNKILDNNLKYTVVKADGNIVLCKADAMKYFRSVEGIDQNCLVNTVTVSKTPDVTIIKIYLKYETYTRLNYVTMVNSNKGWKVTNIYSLVQQKNDKK